MKKLKLEYSKVGEDKEWASSCELMHISCFGFSFSKRDFCSKIQIAWVGLMA